MSNNDLINKVEELNRRIQSNNTAVNRNKAILEEREIALERALKELEKITGHKIGMKDVRVKLPGLIEELESKVRAEVELKTKVLESVNGGDIETASALLGVPYENQSQDSISETGDAPVENKQPAPIPVSTSVPAPKATFSLKETLATNTDDDSEDDDDLAVLYGGSKTPIPSVVEGDETEDTEEKSMFDDFFAEEDENEATENDILNQLKNKGQAY